MLCYFTLLHREEFDDVVADPRVKSWFAALEVDMGEAAHSLTHDVRSVFKSLRV